MSTKRKKLKKPFEIRELNIFDSKDYQKALNESKDYLEHFLDWGINASNYDLEQCKNIITLMNLEKHPNRTFGICIWGKVVGEISIGEGSRSDGLQVTYWVSKKHAGKGLCSRALKNIVDKCVLMEYVNFVEIHADKRNLASQKVARNAGFVHYDSYEYEDHGTLGIGIMDVFIYLTPRARYHSTMAKFFGKQGLNLNIRPDNWRRKQDLSLISTKTMAF